jgi:hypothetical protein
MYMDSLRRQARGHELRQVVAEAKLRRAEQRVIAVTDATISSVGFAVAALVDNVNRQTLVPKQRKVNEARQAKLKCEQARRQGIWGGVVPPLR